MFTIKSLKKKADQITAVLLAGGRGTRMESSLPKQYLLLKDKCIAQYSFDLFLSHPEISEIVLVCEEEYRNLFMQKSNTTLITFATPGKRRQDSFYNGLQASQINNSFICVHDAARPVLTYKLLENVIAEARTVGAAVLGMPVKFTVKESDQNEFVKKTLDRNYIWEIQTPQIAKKKLFEEAFIIVNEKALSITDDMSLIEILEHPIKLVRGSYSNLKITTPEDLSIAGKFLEIVDLYAR